MTNKKILILLVIVAIVGLLIYSKQKSSVTDNPDFQAASQDQDTEVENGEDDKILPEQK